MKCLLATKNKRLYSGLAALLWLISPASQAEIKHIQLEFYDFATDKYQLHNVEPSSSAKGVIHFGIAPADASGEAHTEEYRLCLDKTETRGYFRLLSKPDTPEKSQLEGPLAKFAHEQDLHLSLLPLPGDRRLIYFADTTVLWVTDNAATLASSPDCKR